MRLPRPSLYALVLGLVLPVLALGGVTAVVTGAEGWLAQAALLVSDLVSPPGPLPSFVLDPALEPARASSLDSLTPFHDGCAEFEVRVHGEVVPFEIMALTALPGETVELSVPEPAAQGVMVRFSAGAVRESLLGRWEWTAPKEPGPCALRLESPAARHPVLFNVLVMHPSTRVLEGKLNGYRIGLYRTHPLHGDSAYLPPRGFIEAGSGERDLLVSPHFTLGQFIPNPRGDPGYLALSLPLLLKLEAMLAAYNQSGHQAATFHIMSGFRTPASSAASARRYSRHLYGDAADVYVDADRDGRMDDLNGDGRSDIEDARVLYDLVVRLELSGRPDVVAGGLGLYDADSAHGAYVHVDARGTPHRW
jgi:hypothetical protein